MSIIEKTLSAFGFEKRERGVDGWPVSLAASPVTPTTAESLSAVQACVSAISETIGSLPLHLYRRNDDGRQKAQDHALYRVLHDAPNDRQTAVEFREQMTAAMLLRGNAYARIVRGSDGQVHRDNDPSNNDPDNLASCCHECHSRKTQADMGKRVSWGCDANGMPLDPKHHWSQR